jgi:hypothetical protein
MTSGINEKELLGRISELPREIEPEHDVWPQISARIGAGAPESAAPERNRFWIPRAVAAAAVMAVAAGLLFFMNDAPTPPESPQLADERQLPGRFALLMEGNEAEYQAAFREFVAIGESREYLEPLIVEQIENSWVDMLRTENELASALELNPNDPFLNRRMLELRERQLGFLRQIASLERKNRRLTI